MRLVPQCLSAKRSVTRKHDNLAWFPQRRRSQHFYRCVEDTQCLLSSGVPEMLPVTD